MRMHTYGNIRILLLNFGLIHCLSKIKSRAVVTMIEEKYLNYV